MVGAHLSFSGTCQCFIVRHCDLDRCGWRCCRSKRTTRKPVEGESSPTHNGCWPQCQFAHTHSYSSFPHSPCGKTSGIISKIAAMRNVCTPVWFEHNHFKKKDWFNKFLSLLMSLLNNSQKYFIWLRHIYKIIWKLTLWFVHNQLHAPCQIYIHFLVFFFPARVCNAVSLATFCYATL